MLALLRFPLLCSFGPPRNLTPDLTAETKQRSYGIATPGMHAILWVANEVEEPVRNPSDGRRRNKQRACLGTYQASSAQTNWLESSGPTGNILTEFRCANQGSRSWL